MVDCVETALQPSLMLLHLRLRLSTYGAQEGAFFFMRGSSLLCVIRPRITRITQIYTNFLFIFNCSLLILSKELGS